MIAILDEDPELCEALGAAERTMARHQLVAPLAEVRAGAWEPGGLGREGGLGLLVVDGLVMRSLSLAGRMTGELLGAGDVLRPWDLEDGLPPVDVEVEWTVLAPLRLAVLDARFVSAAGAWPAVVEVLWARTVARSHGLVVQLSVSQVPRVEARLLLLLWKLADRWGRVTPDGVLVPIRLTHELLGALVTARRPSVTSALGRLSEQGLVRRADPGWLLAHHSAEGISALLSGQGS